MGICKSSMHAAQPSRTETPSTFPPSPPPLVLTLQAQDTANAPSNQASITGAIECSNQNLLVSSSIGASTVTPLQGVVASSSSQANDWSTRQSNLDSAEVANIVVNQGRSDDTGDASAKLEGVCRTTTSAAFADLDSLAESSVVKITAGPLADASGSTTKTSVDPRKQATPIPPSQRPMYECGVSLRFLNHWLQDNLPSGQTTREFVEQVIMAKTADKQCRYVDLLDPVDVGPPDFFISHNWGMQFADVLSMIYHYFHNSIGFKNYFLWMDIFAVNQNEHSPQRLHEIEHLNDYLRQAIQISQRTLMCMDPDGIALTRIWVLHEAAVTLDKGHSSLQVLFDWGKTSHDKIANVVRTLDVENAQATILMDKEIIMADINKREGGSKQMLVTLKEVLTSSLRQQLGHGIDVVPLIKNGDMGQLTNDMIQTMGDVHAGFLAKFYIDKDKAEIGKMEAEDPNIPAIQEMMGKQFTEMVEMFQGLGELESRFKELDKLENQLKETQESRLKELEKLKNQLEEASTLEVMTGV